MEIRGSQGHLLGNKRSSLGKEENEPVLTSSSDRALVVDRLCDRDIVQNTPVSCFCWNSPMLLTMRNISGTHSTFQTRTQPIPLSFKQRSSDMRLGSLRLSEGERKPGVIIAFMRPGKPCLASAYPHTIRQTSAEVLGIGAAPEVRSQMYGGY